MTDSVVDANKEFEIKILKDELDKAKKLISKYQVLLKEVDEDADPNLVSDEEIICMEQIAKLRKESEKRDLSSDEVKRFDLLHKNLKLARGEDLRVNWKGHASKMSDKDLEKLAKTQ